MIGLIALAIALFATTNIDDVFVLIAFFSNPDYTPRAIVVGQCAGIAMLYGAAVVASLASLVVPEIYLGLLGLFPIWLGLKALLWRKVDDDDGEETPAAGRAGLLARAVAVAGVTIANGGDNIGVYTPVFALRTWPEIALIGAVFAVMVGVWCAAARWLVHHPRLGAPIRRYGPAMVPYVLIALGIWVLYEAGTIRAAFAAI